MTQSIIIDKADIITLKNLDIGPRIRFIREKHRNDLGASYSIRSVVKRIGGISPAAFASIERGDTKEPSARLLHAIANDFGIALETFFDDYYDNDVDEIKIDIQSDSHNNSNIKDVSLKSDKHKLGFYIYEENIQGERRRVFEEWTSATLDNVVAEQLISSIISQVDTTNLCLSRGSNITPSFERVNKRYKAQVEHPHAFPWIPQHLWNQYSNELNKKAVQLMKQSEKTLEQEE